MYIPAPAVAMIPEPGLRVESRKHVPQRNIASVAVVPLRLCLKRNTAKRGAPPFSVCRASLRTGRSCMPKKSAPTPRLEAEAEAPDRFEAFARSRNLNVRPEQLGHYSAP